YRCEERLWEMGRRAVKYVNALGGEGLTTTIGWPQEVGQRWADKIWPLSHKLVAQAAGLGVIGLSRNFLHRKFGAYCLIDTVLTNLEWPAYDAPIAWNPCVQCNLCVASCPTEAIKPEGDFDFFACYNHTYRDSIPGFLDLVRDLSERSRRAFRKRWADAGRPPEPFRRRCPPRLAPPHPHPEHRRDDALDAAVLPALRGARAQLHDPVPSRRRRWRPVVHAYRRRSLRGAPGGDRGPGP